jgi:hypothetical protein
MNGGLCDPFLTFERLVAQRVMEGADSQQKSSIEGGSSTRGKRAGWKKEFLDTRQVTRKIRELSPSRSAFRRDHGLLNC